MERRFSYVRNGIPPPDCDIYYLWDTDYGRSLGGDTNWTSYWVCKDFKDGGECSFSREMRWMYTGKVPKKPTRRDTEQLIQQMGEITISVSARSVFEAWKKLSRPRPLRPQNLRTRMKVRLFLRKIVKAWKLVTVRAKLTRFRARKTRLETHS